MPLVCFPFSNVIPQVIFLWADYFSRPQTLNSSVRVHYIILQIHKASPINKGAFIHPPASDLLKLYMFYNAAVFSGLDKYSTRVAPGGEQGKNTRRRLHTSKQLLQTMED